MRKPTISLPSSAKQIIKGRYDSREIHMMLCAGHADIGEYNTYLHNEYNANKIPVRESVIIDNQTQKPWFVAKIFYDVDERIKPRVYKAMEKMGEKTNRRVFGSSANTEPLILNALASKGSLTASEIRSFKELEAIIVAESQMLEVRDKILY